MSRTNLTFYRNIAKEREYVTFVYVKVSSQFIDHVNGKHYFKKSRVLTVIAGFKNA